LKQATKRRNLKWTAALAAGFLLLSAWLGDKLYPLQLPDKQQIFARVVTDRHGYPLRTFADSEGVWRYQVSLDQVSPRYVEALLGYEDRWFWHHPGVNPIAMMRAAWLNMRYGRLVSGGSTLTMQVARLLHPHPRTMTGKLQQVLRAFQLEWHLSKDQILTLYLNLAPFGGTRQGVQAASFAYLGKPADQLSDAEAALLAVLPQAPSRLRPDRYPDRAKAARDKVLNRLAEHSIWTRAEVADAMVEPVLALAPELPVVAPLLARRLIKEAPRRAVIGSTLDIALQQRVAGYVRQFSRRLPEQTSAAVLVVDNATAEVLVYVGSADFGSSERFGHVDMVQAWRSPGSTLKPFLYGMALDQGMIHTQSLLADVPRSWGTYRPENFSRGFSGPVSVTDALQRSLNVPVIDLLERYGPKRFVTELGNAGLPLTIPGGSGNLAVILGGAGARLEQLVAAYRALANGGQVQALKFTADEVLPPGRYLFSPQSAWLVQQMLSDIRGTDQFNSSTLFRDKQRLAWKTGTSYGFRDAWAIGVSATYTIGVWVGRPDGTASPGQSGRNTAGRLLFAVADRLPDAFTPIAQPEGVSEQPICWPSGRLASLDKAGHCHQRRNAWLIDGQAPPTWHSVEQQANRSSVFSFWVDPVTGKRVAPECPVAGQRRQSVALWPQMLEPWLPASYRRSQQIPALADGCGLSQSLASRFSIIGLEDGSRIRAAGASKVRPEISLQVSGGEGRVSWYINGRFWRQIGASVTAVYQPERSGPLQIVAVDDAGQVARTEITVVQ